METKIKNLGKQLEKALKERGVSKKHVCKILGITHPTLHARLIDGEFKPSQIAILENEKLL